MKIFVTNLPSFYKINLFNSINEREQILVIYTSKTEESRNADFYNGTMQFDYLFLTEKGLHKYIQLFSIIRKYKKECRELILDGWDTKENWFLAFISSKKLNGLIVESSYYESIVTGIKGFAKKVFLSRISTTYPCGIAQKELLLRLNFKKIIKTTGSVGVMTRYPQPAYSPRQCVSKFLYVGRLVEVKNLELLIRAFNELPDLHLDIIGFGVLEERLKSIAGKNISFLGAIDNADLGQYYQVSDVFILPSKSETWGLVVEEALNNGCPVIVSDHVGCKDDLVTEETGLVFKSCDKEELKNTILKMTDIDLYNKFRLGVSKLNFAEREKNQIEAYL